MQHRIFNLISVAWSWGYEDWKEKGKVKAYLKELRMAFDNPENLRLSRFRDNESTIIKEKRKFIEMLNIKNIKFENKEDFYKIVDLVAQEENSPIILVSTSEAARGFFIKELTAVLLKKYNIHLHNTSPDKILNNFINSVLERGFCFLKWKEFLNVGQALCMDGIEFFGGKTTCQKELWFFLRDFTKPLLLGLRDKLPQHDNLFIPQLREFVERGKVIKLVLKNDIVSIQEV